MFSLVIGQPYDLTTTEWPEGCHYNFDDSGHWLHYMFHNPSKVEIESIQGGAAQFALYVEDPCIFLLHQFGGMLWNDTPYSWWLVSEEHRTLPDTNPTLHALLKVVLIDSSNGIVKGLRALTFSAEFTLRLQQEIRRQAVMPWSRVKHEEVIQSIYQTYSSAEMAERAVIRCKGGD
jgi:hypothetical protein